MSEPEESNVIQIQTAPQAPRLMISAELGLPPNAVTQSLAIVAQRGSGKTYAAKKLAEEFLKNDLPIVVIDLLGVFHGIQSSSDGRSPGFAIPIFGGGRGNMRLDLDMGRTLARWVCAGEVRPRSLVIDLSLMRKVDQQRLVTEFAEELYFLNDRSLHIILDEADFFVPQRLKKNEQRMFDVFDSIVRRGRAKGFGITMITQRPAVLSKDVLTQVAALVVMRMAGPQDQKAIRAWIEYHSNRYEQEYVMATVGSLPVGVAWIWSPGWLKRLKKIKIAKQETWDSSFTPAADEPKRFPKVRATIDVERIREELKTCAPGEDSTEEEE